MFAFQYTRSMQVELPQNSPHSIRCIFIVDHSAAEVHRVKTACTLRDEDVVFRTTVRYAQDSQSDVRAGCAVDDTVMLE